MLTTWRRLHIERDSLGRVVNNFVAGEITNTSQVSGTGDTILKINQTLSENNRFVNGRIEITTPGAAPPTQSYKIVLSTAAFPH